VIGYRRRTRRSPRVHGGGQDIGGAPYTGVGERYCGSHPQHHRVWFKFVDLVTRIGSARLRCTEFEVFHHFYTVIGFEKYYFEKNVYTFSV